MLVRTESLKPDGGTMMFKLCVWSRTSTGRTLSTRESAASLEAANSGSSHCCAS